MTAEPICNECSDRQCIIQGMIETLEEVRDFEPCDPVATDYLDMLFDNLDALRKQLKNFDSLVPAA
jgi:hypothetical protein